MSMKYQILLNTYKLSNMIKCLWNMKYYQMCINYLILLNIYEIFNIIKYL